VKDKISQRINETEYVKQFKDSEDYERINKLRAEYQEFKGELKEQITNSENPLLQKATGKIDQIRENRWERAILKMKLYDADFDLENLTFEAEEVFKEFYCNFLAGNKNYMELVCESQV